MSTFSKEGRAARKQAATPYGDQPPDYTGWRVVLTEAGSGAVVEAVAFHGGSPVDHKRLDELEEAEYLGTPDRYAEDLARLKLQVAALDHVARAASEAAGAHARKDLFFLALADLVTFMQRGYA